MEQNIREIMHETTIHFNPARSKIGEQVTRQVNLGKAVDDYSNRDVPMDWEKKMMEELARLMLKRNLITIDLATLVIRGVKKSLFANWIMEELKLKDFTLPIFKMLEKNSDPIKHIFQFQQKMVLENINEEILCKVFLTTLIGPILLWFRQLFEKSINSIEAFVLFS